MFLTIELSQFQKTHSQFGGTEPFAIYFVYPKDGTPVVIKGMSDEVKDYVAKHFPVALYHYTFWHEGKSRGSWRFTMNGIYAEKCNGRYTITIYDKSGKLVRTFSLRRMPKKWIPEFDLVLS